MKVVSVFYRGRAVVKTNRAYHANSASQACFGHMRSNRYEATHAEVYDERDGVLHAVFKRTTDDKLITLFKREYAEGV